MNDLGTWTLAQPLEGLRISAESDGVVLRADNFAIDDFSRLRSLPQRSRLGRLLPTLLQQLLELELAESSQSAVTIPYSSFVVLKDHDIDAFEDVVPWAPFALEIESSGVLGRETFRYSYRFYSGTEVAYPQRLGCFVKRGDQVFRLDREAFQLVDAIEKFNALPSERKTSVDAFIRFSQIKGLGEGVGAQLDDFISKERIIVPSRVGLDLIVEDGGRVTFAPKFDGASEDQMRKAFLAGDDVDQVYSLDDGSGGKVRVVLAEEHREVLRRMQRVRHLGGAERAEVLRDPNAAFDGVANSVDIDLRSYGPRVRGIGDFPFVIQPYLKRNSAGIFDDSNAPGEKPQRAKVDAGLKCQYADGSAEDVKFRSRDEILSIQRQAHDAFRSGEGAIEYNGKSIVLEPRFLVGLDELADRVCSAPQAKKEKGPRRFLLIYTNNDDVEFSFDESQREEIEKELPELPHSLRKSIDLKPHQLQGLAWLQRNHRYGRGGCLLADDMGLGKTLQTLLFLAQIMDEWKDTGPWKPVLVIAPLILLDEEGPWLKDMRTYFEGDGAVFRPWLTLHASTLRGLKKEQGKEIELGSATLNLDELRQHRIVFTNYETITNYQHSFAKMRSDWSIVVTDEAQEYKTPNTKISHALKSLAPSFRLALTGTPVETRLLDVWNIFDFLQPGGLLGSARDFTSRYENQARAGAAVAESPAVVTELKQRLRFGAPDAFLLRREKASLGSILPAKHEVVLDCELSAKQREQHLELIQAARAASGDSRMKFMWEVMRLHQHPALVPRYEPVLAKAAVQDCPKLEAVVRKLRDIERRGEKALIFTRHLDMQQLLAEVLSSEFNLTVDILNGSTSRSPTGGRVANTRSAIVKRFRETRGFNLIVLSPDVAGLGLNLVEANHVFHYGRWWNPAKEAQATDRVYRIGQTKDVFVYHPVARDPLGQFKTFDETLHEILDRRRSLASEFLAPIPNESALEAELFDNVLSQGATSDAHAAKPISEEDIRRLTPNLFESLIALLFERSGAEILLTPYERDEGIDVIGIRQFEIRLVQCRHMLSEAVVTVEAAKEVIEAFDGYRARRLRQASKGRALVPAIATNGAASKSTRNYARERGLQIIEREELVRLVAEARLSLLEVEAMEHRRLESMPEVQVVLDSNDPR